MSVISPKFSLQQNWRTRGWNRFYQKQKVGEKGEVEQTMYTSKCKNDKIKGKKNKNGHKKYKQQ
jgi:hypothetical protein